MVFHGIRRQVRQLHRDGRLPVLTRTAGFLWYQYKSLPDLRFMREVRQELGAGRTPADLEAKVGFVMDRFGGAIRPNQDRTEITELVRRVAARAPKTVLEIGTARGGTLFLLCQAAHASATVISLDLPCSDGGYPRWKEPTYAAFARPGQKLVMLRGDSHDPSSLKRVEAALEGRKLDFIMIDGDHSHDGVRQDFEMYATLLAPDGMIALHDILENPADPSIDVHRFWKQIAPRHRSDAIVRDPGQAQFGIGLVWPGSAGPEAVAARA